MNTSNLRPLLIDVLNRGLSQAFVAREIGLARATVNLVVHSDKPWCPRYKTGEKLVRLHQRTCANQPNRTDQ